MSQSSEISLWPRFSLRVWLSLAGAAGAAGLAWLGWKLRRPTREVKVAALYIYPIKGCRGHSLAKAKVTKWGLEDDRTAHLRVLSPRSLCKDVLSLILVSKF